MPHHKKIATGRFILCIKLGSHNFFPPLSAESLRLDRRLLTYSCIYQSLAKSINSFENKQHKIIHHGLFLLND